MPISETARLIFNESVRRRRREARSREFAVARRLGLDWRTELRREIERARKGDYLIEVSPDLMEALLDYIEGDHV